MKLILELQIFGFMKKLTRKNLEELAKQMPIIDKKSQKYYIGGGDGSRENPYTIQEFEDMSARGVWQGGHVSGYGYTYPDVIFTASFTGGEDVNRYDIEQALSDNQTSFWSGLLGLAGGSSTAAHGVVSSAVSALQENDIMSVLNYMEKNGVNSLYMISKTVSSSAPYSDRSPLYNNITTFEFYDRTTGNKVGSYKITY